MQHNKGILNSIRDFINVGQVGDDKVEVTLTPAAIQMLKGYYAADDEEYAARIVNFVLEEAKEPESIKEVEDKLDLLEKETVCREFLSEKVKLLIDSVHTTEKNSFIINTHHCEGKGSKNCTNCIQFLL